MARPPVLAARARPCLQSLVGELAGQPVRGLDEHHIHTPLDLPALPAQAGMDQH
jgi:hypothetical protein